ncbi:hypothetical protein ABVK25_009582 [Lepraria finkii]|uniref:Uncharacterized protein n=1 Tax=Lepraria finkii TaxID=1340010 RepID=A0ABR4AZU9_9LECA
MFAQHGSSQVYLRTLPPVKCQSELNEGIRQRQGGNLMEVEKNLIRIGKHGARYIVGLDGEKIMFDKAPTLRSSAARFRRLLGLPPGTAQHVQGTPLATKGRAPLRNCGKSLTDSLSFMARPG